MLMVTRTDSVVEVGNADRRFAAFDAGHVTSAMLCVERAACGRIIQALVLAFGDGVQPLRLEGSPMELAAVHQTVAEVMQDSAASRAVH